MNAAHTVRMFLTELDWIVQAFTAEPGVAGARLTGAGGAAARSRSARMRMSYARLRRRDAALRARFSHAGDVG